MCLMCEQEYMYQLYLDYLAQQEAEAKAGASADASVAPEKPNPFACDDGAPAATSVTTPKVA